MLRHILRECTGRRRIGMLVNDMADVNVDAATMASDTAARKHGRGGKRSRTSASPQAPAVAAAAAASEMLESLSGGCICCTLRPDFVRQLAEMAAVTPRLDAIIVESTGISEPQQVAEVFDIPAADGALAELPGEQVEEADAKDAELARWAATLRERCRLDCMVTVVDALNFPRDLRSSADSLVDRGMALSSSDARTVSELLVEQVEFANVVYINKLDLVSPSEAGRLVALLRALAPRADVRMCTHSAVPPEAVLDTRMFDLAAARASPGWLASLTSAHVPESVEFGITNVIFRARRPFHPGRLYALLFSELQTGGKGERNDAGVDDREGSEVAGAPLDGEPKTSAPEVAKKRGRRSGGGGAAASAAASTAGPRVDAPKHPCAAHLELATPADVLALSHVVRSKGVAWLGTDWGHRQRLDWSQAGKIWQFSPGAPWLGAAPLDEWPEGAAAALNSRGTWRGDDAFVGDRESEVVLIGVGMDCATVLGALQRALLTDAELEDKYKPALVEDAAYAAAEASAIARKLAAETVTVDSTGASGRSTTSSRLRSKNRVASGSNSATGAAPPQPPVPFTRAQRREMERALSALRSPAWAGGWEFEYEDDSEDEDADDDDGSMG